jgi:AcrR family transcriptional regulator/DNA-binding MarR family transcriptional regulator
MPPREDHGSGAPEFTATCNRLAREHVSDIQRSRIFAATVDVIAEHGAANVTVAHIVARSGVSRRTFYELFSDREECFLAVFDEAVARASEHVMCEYDPTARWRDRVRHSLAALLQFLDDEPGIGRLLIVESLGAGARALKRRTLVLDRLIDVVDQGRTEGKRGSSPSPLTAEGIVGGVLAVIHSRLLEYRCPPLAELIGPLTSMIVRPYLGSVAAQREIERPTPRPASRAHNGTGDPLRGLGMRLTYRTVRVLVSIGAHPGCSNRRIGLESGIEDQGQISKLLTRLHKLGLIENGPTGLARGAPNAWTLTPKGSEVEAAVGQQGGWAPRAEPVRLDLGSLARPKGSTGAETV